MLTVIYPELVKLTNVFVDSWGSTAGMPKEEYIKRWVEPVTRERLSANCAGFLRLCDTVCQLLVLFA